MDGRPDGRTDGRMEGRPDGPSYRDARTHLYRAFVDLQKSKKMMFFSRGKSIEKEAEAGKGNRGMMRTRNGENDVGSEFNVTDKSPTTLE